MIRVPRVEHRRPLTALLFPEREIDKNLTGPPHHIALETAEGLCPLLCDRSTTDYTDTSTDYEPRKPLEYFITWEIRPFAASYYSTLEQHGASFQGQYVNLASLHAGRLSDWPQVP